jgi:hypothetical protein
MWPAWRVGKHKGPKTSVRPNHQNTELQKQVDELQNHVITCLQIESEKQKEFAWLASHSNERNTHLVGAVEKLEFERQRGAERMAEEEQRYVSKNWLQHTIELRPSLLSFRDP